MIKRRPGLVDQDAVDLVDDRVEELALRLRLAGRLHVVAEIVEAELVVGSIGDVAGVDLLPLGGLHLGLDGADRHAQALEQRAHPLGVAAGEVVVDRDDVDAVAVEGIQVGGQGGDQGLAFAGDHLGDAAAVQDHAAHQLDVEMPHVQVAAARLAAGGERLGEQVVERFPASPPPAQLLGLGAELLRRQRRHARLELVDLGHDRPHLADLPLVGAAEQPDQTLGDVFGERREGVGRLIPNLSQQFHCHTGLAEVQGIGELSLLKIKSYSRSARSVKPTGRRTPRAVPGPHLFMGQSFRISSPAGKWGFGGTRRAAYFRWVHTCVRVIVMRTRAIRVGETQRNRVAPPPGSGWIRRIRKKSVARRANNGRAALVLTIVWLKERGRSCGGHPRRARGSPALRQFGGSRPRI